MRKVRKKRIEVGFAFKQELDFSLLNEDYALGSIDVEKDLWIEYVSKRYEFEFLHNKLWTKLPIRWKRKFMEGNNGNLGRNQKRC